MRLGFYTHFIFPNVCTVTYYKVRPRLFPNEPFIHMIVRRFDQSKVTIKVKEFKEPVGELARAVAHRTVTSPWFKLFALMIDR